MMQTNTVVFPGTFDPITNGHIDLIERACKMFSQVIVAVAENTRKAPCFTIEKRVELAQSVLQHLPQVKVQGFKILLVDFARAVGAKAIIRGVRAVSDFEYEFQLANMNRRLYAELETVFLIPAEQHAFVSSSLIKEIAQLGGDVRSFVPEKIQQALYAKFQNKSN